MSGIRFGELAERFVGALELAGATVLIVRGIDRRPLELGVVLGDLTYRLEVHLWTVTPGGKGRGRPWERRIQKTGVPQFTLQAGVRTIVGGWNQETGVFAFWDVRRHLESSRNSPSFQISVNTLETASAVGMATQVRKLRGAEEIAIGVHPDYLMWYVQEYERLYDCGHEIAEATALVDAKPEDEREFIDTGDTAPTQSRRYKVVSVVQAFREARFRPLVLRAYSYRCCLTGVALRLVDAAHIVPVADPTSTDEPRNGIALNPLLHRAYDCGLLGILPGGKTALNPRMVVQLKKQRLDAGIDLLRRSIPTVMKFPVSPEFHPPDDYLLRGLQARGWTASEMGP